MNIKSDMVRSDDNEFVLYEIGKTHIKTHQDDESLPAEMERLALVIAADDKTAKRKYEGAPYFMARMYLDAILPENAEYLPLETNDNPISAPFEKSRSALVSVGGQVVGIVGEFRSTVKKSLKLPDFCAGFEIDITLLLDHQKSMSYSPISILPKASQDLTVSVEAATSYADVKKSITKTLNATSERGYQYELRARDIFKSDEAERVHMTFRIWLWHSQKTLTTDETTTVIDTIATDLRKSLKAEKV